MRAACPFTLHLLLLLLACTCAALVSGDANVTLFQDAACSSPYMSGVFYISLPSSSECVDTSGWPAAMLFTCQTTPAVNLTFALFNATADCPAGDSIFSMRVAGPAAGCDEATITGHPQPLQLYAYVNCSSSTDAELGHSSHKDEAATDWLRQWREVLAQSAPTQPWASDIREAELRKG